MGLWAAIGLPGPIDTFKQALINLDIKSLQNMGEKKLKEILDKMNYGDYDNKDYLNLVFKKTTCGETQKIKNFFEFLLPYIPKTTGLESLIYKFWNYMREFEEEKGCNIRDSIVTLFTNYKYKKDLLENILEKIQYQIDQLRLTNRTEKEDNQIRAEIDATINYFTPLIQVLGGKPPKLVSKPLPNVTKKKKTVGGTRKKRKSMRKNRTRK